MADRSSVDFMPAQASDNVAAVRVTEPSTVVIFGATGDLTARKLIPAFVRLAAQGLLPGVFSIVGVARRTLTDLVFRESLKQTVDKHLSRAAAGRNADVWDALAPGVHYCPLRFDQPADYRRLTEFLERIETERGAPGQRLFYLATAPEFFQPIVENLSAAGLIRGPGDRCPSRVIIEKPFGHDLESALALNRGTGRVLDEDQIYRIDHYL
ncbi:MAG: glucose-6-phosphate dehydrogenase, partial [Planctomycetes bacterium]|nr:glucose-6-phosphate dehydrogenase [Planctomycetota bacterium]